jgi:hypothetical protein
MKIRVRVTDSSGDDRIEPTLIDLDLPSYVWEIDQTRAVDWYTRDGMEQVVVYLTRVL